MPSLREKMEFLRPHVAMLGKASPIVQAMMEWIEKADETLKEYGECDCRQGRHGALCYAWKARRTRALLDAPIKE